MRERSETGLSGRLRGLPPVAPGPAARDRVLRAMAAAVPSAAGPVATAAAPPPRSRTADRLSLAAGVATVAVLLSLMAHRFAAPDVEAPPPASVAAVGDVDAAVEPLIEVSWLLERALDELPAQRRVMGAGTASTIAALQTRIAAIDEQLGDAGPVTLDPELRQALWRDRVSTMSALYQVRYGQSRHFTF